MREEGKETHSQEEGEAQPLREEGVLLLREEERRRIGDLIHDWELERYQNLGFTLLNLTIPMDNGGVAISVFPTNVILIFTMDVSSIAETDSKVLTISIEVLLFITDAMISITTFIASAEMPRRGVVIKAPSIRDRNHPSMVVDIPITVVPRTHLSAILERGFVRVVKVIVHGDGEII